MLDLFKKKTKVILDTNFLLIPGEFGVDIFSEINRIMIEPYEVCILKKSMDELEILIQRMGKKKEALNAKLGFIMAKQKGLKTLRSSSEAYADDELLEFVKANPKGVVVATQDAELKKKILNASGRIIELKQKSHLVLR